MARKRHNAEMQIIISGDYFFSVDEDGIPDHVYIGLVKDDGSLPSDYIKKENELEVKECLWCHVLFNGDFIFCDDCMEDEASFQDRWNIASQIEGELVVEGYGDKNTAYHPDHSYWNERGEFIYFDDEDNDEMPF